ncbi:MAG TPA: lycopene cyclase domain-containing protein [Polyangiaceae bacterium]|nr:lycopene cyclase domain-containing protein [Polyangiaceae bacterium]
MVHQYVFFWGSLALTLLWTIAYVWARGQRDVILVGTGLALPLSFLEPWFLRDYWAPASLFQLSERVGLSIESFAFSFALGGLAPLPGLLFVPRIRSSLFEPRARRTVFALYVTLIASMGALGTLSSLNSIYAVCLSQFLVGVGSAALRPRLLPAVLAGGLGSAAWYYAGFLALDALFPDFIAGTYYPHRFLASALFGVPLEEVLFAASAGMSWCGMLLWSCFDGPAEPASALSQPAAVASERIAS